MKFRKTDLIDRIDTIVAERERAVAEAKEKAEAEAYEARCKWLDVEGPKFVQFADTIIAKVRDGEPVTKSDLPEEIRDSYYGGTSMAFFKPEKVVEQKLGTEGLLTLKTALESIEDEFVTTTGLREIGFKDIARLFRRTT